MFKSVEIRNLGPHERAVFDFAPDGATVISGPSKVGKTFALRAVCFALWGCDTDGRPLPSGAVRDGQERAEVTLTAASGTVVRRTLTRRGAVTRSIHRAGQSAPVRYNSDRDFAAALPTALASDAARIVAVPESWRDLAAGNARPLRDLIASLLPTADVAAVVARLIAPAPLRPQDPLDETGAAEARRKANASRDRAAGALDAARAAVQSADGPTTEDVAAADAAADAAARTIAHDAGWTLYDDACAARDKAAAVAARELAEWQRRKAALPAEVTAEELTAARNAAESAKRTLADLADAAGRWRYFDAACERHAEDRAAAAAARERRVVAKAAFDAHVAAIGALRGLLSRADAAEREMCATCGQPMPIPEDLRDQIATAHDAERAAGEAYRIEESAARRCERDLALGQDEPSCPPLPRPSDADVAHAAAEATRLARLCADLESRAAARAAALRALGQRPVAEASTPIPAPPVPRPSDDEVAAARAAVAVARDLRAQFAAAERQRSRAAATVTEAEAALSAAESEAARLDALVDAVRRAPSEIARDQAEALGDLGPVTLAWGDGTAQSPAVSVLVDGRLWNLASTGAQVVADVYLRAAIRRLAKLVPLPIWIDRVQDVAGLDLPRPGACVLLVTRDGALRCEADDEEGNDEVEGGVR